MLQIRFLVSHLILELILHTMHLVLMHMMFSKLHVLHSCDFTTFPGFLTTLKIYGLIPHGIWLLPASFVNICRLYNMYLPFLSTFFASYSVYLYLYLGQLPFVSLRIIPSEFFIASLYTQNICFKSYPENCMRCMNFCICFCFVVFT